MNDDSRSVWRAYGGQRQLIPMVEETCKQVLYNPGYVSAEHMNKNENTASSTSSRLHQPGIAQLFQEERDSREQRQPSLYR